MRHLSTASLFASLGLATVASAQWTSIATPTSPAARVGSSAAFDTVRGRMVMFGGEVGFSFSSQTWLYDGSDWSLAAPATTPVGRSEAGLAMDTQRGKVVMYGGNIGGGPWGGPAVDETWEWNGTDWTLAAPATTPGGLARFGIAYDSTRHRTVVYGGLQDLSFPIAAADTWEYDGTTWTLVATAASPGPRENPAVCFDAARNRVVMFGGVDPQVGGFGDTWTYDGSNWTRLPASAGSPGARTGSRMVYDPNRQVCLLYGGQDATNGAIQNDVWQFDGTVWTQLVVGGIGARFGSAAAYDVAHGHLVLFGGMDSNYATNGETWEFGARARSHRSSCVGSAGPVVLASNNPVLGRPYQLALSGMNPASTNALFAFGFSDTNWSGNALPFDLTIVGMTGCMLYTSPDIVIGTSAAAGNATLTLPVPVMPTLVGLAFWNQAFAPDAGHNPFGMVTSNAIAAKFGY